MLEFHACPLGSAHRQTVGRLPTGGETKTPQHLTNIYGPRPSRCRLRTQQRKKSYCGRRHSGTPLSNLFTALPVSTKARTARAAPRITKLVTGKAAEFTATLCDWLHCQVTCGWPGVYSLAISYSLARGGEAGWSCMLSRCLCCSCEDACTLST